ncbi:Contactin-associated protein 1 [Labeo rohita]|uniref:Contactin-associated protein 1 n=1 Tax=Labeo rohita TaxID=84645 RepID=A0ABQ8MI18_LABRO|nr:Contactin-associated protein 1 [Labeo rohita]
MCWFAPITQRWSITSTTREVCVRAPYTSWCTRSLCGPRTLRAVHVPGHLNMGADILSRQGLRPGEWILHPEVVKQIWRVFGQAQVDLFATQENAQCPHWYSLTHPAPLGLDAMVQTWPRLRLYAFPPIALLPGVLESAPGWGWGPSSFSSPVLAGASMVLRSDFPLLSQAGGTILHPRPELWKLWVWPLRGWYSAGVSAGSVLSRISPLHFEGLRGGYFGLPCPLGGMSVGKDPLVVRFLRGALRLRPPVRHRVPTWDLAVVLEALCRPPFKPTEESSDHHLSTKTVLLLALTSLKRVGDLQALSVAPSHLEFAPGMAKASLYPRPGTTAYCTPGLLSSSLSGLIVRTLDTYVHRAALWRKTDQLLVCYDPPKRGLPASKHTLSCWIVDAITQAYEFSDLPSPLVIKAHSTRGISASKAFMSGVPMQDICEAAGWSTPLTFVRFYDLDLRVAPGSSVLRPSTH